MKNIDIQNAWNRIQPPAGLKEEIFHKLQDTIRQEQAETEPVTNSKLNPAPSAVIRRRAVVGLIAAAAVALVAVLGRPPAFPANPPTSTTPAATAGDNTTIPTATTQTEVTSGQLPLLDASSILQDMDGGGPFAYPAFSPEEVRNTLQGANPPAKLPVYRNKWVLADGTSTESASNETLQAELTRLVKLFGDEEPEFYFYPPNSAAATASDAIFAFGKHYDFYFCPTDGRFQVLLKEPVALPEGYSLHPEPGDEQADILTRTNNWLCEQYPELIPYSSYATTPPALHYGYDGTPRYHQPLIYNTAAGNEGAALRQRIFEQAEWIGFAESYLTFTPGRPEYRDPEVPPTPSYDERENYFYGISIHYYDLSEVVGNYPTITADWAREQLLQGNFVTLQTDYHTVDPEQIVGVQLTYNTGRRAEYFLPYYEFFVDCSDGKDFAAIENKAEGLREYGSFYVPAIDPQYVRPQGEEIDVN